MITSLVAANTGIPVSASHYEGKGTEDYWEKEIKKQDFPTIEHKMNYEKKRKAVERVLKLTNQGWKRSEIAEELGISYSTVKRYQSLDFNLVHGQYNTARNNKIKPYAEKIKRMLKENFTFRQIEEAIKQDGYDGASSMVRMLDRVIEKYPLVGTVYDIVKSFKNALFSKEPDELEKWLEEAEGLGIEQISSFANGIRIDIDAVKKAIELDYNNGLAEGSVNKLKVIKRIMYGRNSFDLLKGKLLQLELKRKIN